MSRPKLVTLDFTEHDTIAAINLLAEMANNGEIIGMVFALKLNHGRKARRRRMFGATGRLASNVDEGAGIAGQLMIQMGQYALEN